MNRKKKWIALLSVSSCLLLLTGCPASMPTIGGGNSVASGGAAGSSAAEENEQLEKCESPMGTVAVFEDRSLPWWSNYRARYPKLTSTVPVLRLIIQQSNCFVIVERGAALNSMNRERELMNSGQLRSGSNFGGGQMVAADFTLSPSVLFSDETGGMGGALGGIAGGLGSLIGGQIKTNEAETNITVIENRSGVQVSSANGTAKGRDYGFLGALFGGGAGGIGGSYAKTPEGKIITAAFLDSYNQMIIALRNYQAQEVAGGLGKGGGIQIGGEDDQMPQATANAPTVQTASTSGSVRQAVVSQPPAGVRVETRNSVVIVDEYDENALANYYDALKDAVEHMGNFASITPAQVDAIKAQNPQAGAMWGLSMIWGGPHVNRLETSQIELESWPYDARVQAWNSYGSRIVKYNKIFDRHRRTMLANKAYEQSVLDQLGAVQLLTEETFLAR